MRPIYPEKLQSDFDKAMPYLVMTFEKTGISHYFKEGTPPEIIEAFEKAMTEMAAIDDEVRKMCGRY